MGEIRPHGGDALERYLLNMTRRRFFGTAARTVGAGLGATALASLVGAAQAAPRGPGGGPMGEPRVVPPHYAPRAKHVIYMHMEGAPSQLDLFDYKPQLHDRFDEDLPDSIRQGQRFTTMTSGQSRFPVAPSMFKFHRHANNADGVWLSELLPYTGGVAKELCFINSMRTDAINHEPGITFFQTGVQQPGRPSFGSWVSYGLGSESANLPSFVVLISQGFGNMQALSARFWGSGFLPSEHQGCKLRAGENAVLYLKDPEGVNRADRRRMLDLVTRLNEEEFAETLDPEVQARIAQYEMAYRMQMSVPELTDFDGEDPGTLAMYGPEVNKPGTFAANCLLARRLVERGVRFVQLYMRGWDQHNNLPGELRAQCAAVDQAQAALVMDLKRRGLLDQTLVLWGGEFGRTVYSQGTLARDNYGRDHHPRCFSIWLAGGGIRPGITYGKTDDYSYNIVENPVEVHDLHATLLHLLGLNHQRLTYRHQGRDYRLTDVAGHVLSPILA
ncbi:MAG TPA: DUF1501 domain-containing protein [Phycisphaerales bacterium]|nr:DUF1501 domain-containing protein [Phycisphaerales bacterium]